MELQSNLGTSQPKPPYTSPPYSTAIGWWTRLQCLGEEVFLQEVHLLWQATTEQEELAFLEHEVVPAHLKTTPATPSWP